MKQFQMRHSGSVGVDAAISKGLKFLLARQSAQGFWADWQLPPGESLIWTTAYVGYRLSSLCETHRNSAEAAMQKAARWLLIRELPGSGWGYTEEVPCDADSTALAILFLTSQGFSIPERTWERLRKFQRPDGGFATFTAHAGVGSWMLSHPEVTATALMALIPENPSSGPSIERGIAYSRKQMTSAGLWNSFWWKSSLYATESNLLLFRRAGFESGLTRTALRTIRPENSFEHALLILSLLHAGNAINAPELNESVEALLSAQLQDGSWPSVPILRLTDRDCSEPWTRNDAGPLFADQNRIFTSATAVAALCNKESLCQHAVSRHCVI